MTTEYEASHTEKTANSEIRHPLRESLRRLFVFATVVGTIALVSAPFVGANLAGFADVQQPVDEGLKTLGVGVAVTGLVGIGLLVSGMYLRRKILQHTKR